MELIVPIFVAVTLLSALTLTLQKFKKPRLEGKIGPFSFKLSEDNDDEED
jgi:hypothetical protein